MFRPPPPTHIQPFVKNNIEINSDIKSALERPPVHKRLNHVGIIKLRVITKNISLDTRFIEVLTAQTKSKGSPKIGILALTDFSDLVHLL